MFEEGFAFTKKSADLFSMYLDFAKQFFKYEAASIVLAGEISHIAYIVEFGFTKCVLVFTLWYCVI